MTLQTTFRLKGLSTNYAPKMFIKITGPEYTKCMTPK
jgi:hypothetical protein